MVKLTAYSAADVPVSYTHLDVYKRQGQSSMEIASAAAAQGADLSTLTVGGLDVYKRQVHGCDGRRSVYRT